MRPRLLLFTRTTDYRHDSIPAGVAMVEAISGARFDNHPDPQRATILIEDRNHPSTAHREPTWQWDDEWYNFRANPRRRVHVRGGMNSLVRCTPRDPSVDAVEE